ncbi:hypothetical protein Tco_0590653 [Tanacetum coccineum]
METTGNPLSKLSELSSRVVFTLKDEPDVAGPTHASCISGQPRRTSSRSSRLPPVEGDTNAVGSGPNLFGHDDEGVTSLPLVLAREVLQLTQVCGSQDAFPSLVFPLVSLSLPLVSLSFQLRTYNLSTLPFQDTVQIEKVSENNLDLLKVPDKNLEALKVKKKNFDKV